LRTRSSVIAVPATLVVWAGVGLAADRPFSLADVLSPARGIDGAGAGEHKLRVRITAVVNNHVMNLEKVVLVPTVR
jgi:hypothetical protein